ncbi:MAG: ABC transporter permease [Pseudomonadota bacterium]
MTLPSADAGSSNSFDARRSRGIFRSLLSDKSAVLGLGLLALIVGSAALAPPIAPYGPNEANPALRLMGPGTEGHLLGLDHQGRDVLSRMLYGGGLTILTGLAPVVVAALIAVPLGLVAAWVRPAGAVILRLMDVLFAFPMALLAILVAAFLGPGTLNLLTALVLVLLPYAVRVVHQAAAHEVVLPYVEALRVSGTPVWKILFVEILPNVAPPTIVYSCTVLGSIVITAAGLSFLGLGVQPPIAEWGVMVSEGRSVLFVAPHVSVVPGLGLTLLVIACNLVGDSVRDALDPRTRATLNLSDNV